MDIKKTAQQLVNKYRTRDPLVIAEAMGYIVIFAPLRGVRGFYQYYQRCHIIYLDEDLDDGQRRFVCAHELGHSLLHSGFNRFFLDSRTFAVTSRFEREADRFAAELLFDDQELLEYRELSLDQLAGCLGVSRQLAAERMKTISPQLLEQQNVYV